MKKILVTIVALGALAFAVNDCQTKRLNEWKKCNGLEKRALGICLQNAYQNYGNCAEPNKQKKCKALSIKFKYWELADKYSDLGMWGIFPLKEIGNLYDFGCKDCKSDKKAQKECKRIYNKYYKEVK